MRGLHISCVGAHHPPWPHSDEFALEFRVDAQIEEDVGIEAGERDGYGEVEEVEEEGLAFPFPEVDGLLKLVLYCF